MLSYDLIRILQQYPNTEIEIRGNVKEGYLSETDISVDVTEDLIILDI